MDEVDDAEEDAVAVSYTHLDVYKRQASAISGTAAAPMSKVLPPRGGANAGSEAPKVF